MALIVSHTGGKPSTTELHSPASTRYGFHFYILVFKNHIYVYLFICIVRVCISRLWLVCVEVRGQLDGVGSSLHKWGLGMAFSSSDLVARTLTHSTHPPATGVFGTSQAAPARTHSWTSTCSIALCAFTASIFQGSPGEGLWRHAADLHPDPPSSSSFPLLFTERLPRIFWQGKTPPFLAYLTHTQIVPWGHRCQSCLSDTTGQQRCSGGGKGKG